MSRQELRSTGGPDHVTLQALITWLIIKGHRERWQGQLELLSFSSVLLSHIEKTEALVTHFELQNLVVLKWKNLPAM